MSKYNVKVGDTIKIIKDFAAGTAERSGTFLVVTKVYEGKFISQSSFSTTSSMHFRSYAYGDGDGSVWAFDDSCIEEGSIEHIPQIYAAGLS